MGVNKLVINDETKLDLTEDTVTPDSLLEGVTAHDCTGARITGALPTVEQAQPVIETSFLTQANLMVLQIQATSEQNAGVVAAGSKSALHQIAAIPGKTVYPSTRQKLMIASGYYAAGDMYVAGEENLLPENIRSGVSLFGVPGNLSAGGYRQFHLRGEDDVLYGNGLPAELSGGILLLNPLMQNYEFFSENRKNILCAIQNDDSWTVALYQSGYLFSETLELQNDDSGIYLDDTDYAFVPGSPYLLLHP